MQGKVFRMCQIVLSLVCTKMLYFNQGDSGGPLTMKNNDGAHVLMGIISTRLGYNCSRDGFSVFTSISALLPWIMSTIEENGGMASCSFKVTASPAIGTNDPLKL